MKPLIKDGRIVADEWRLLPNDDGCGTDATLDLTPSGPPLILPIESYRLHADTLQAQRHRIGIVLSPDDEPEAVVPFLANIALIAIRFPSFTDGRGYSTARILRNRFGFAGELRAVGDVLRDQLYFLHRCGFNAFSLRPDQDHAAALVAFADYAWHPLSGITPNNDRGGIE